jgi:outer membrane protein OmpA-like peptidoglycan-associated protein
LEERALASEKKMALLSEKLLATIGDKSGKDLLEKATMEENFREISALFAKDEAEVVKVGNDVIIRSYGFYFPVGKSDLLPRNYPLLHKIVSAIVKYPKAMIEVAGHTDSTGSRSINMRLSKERAKNIADFLVEVAGIDAGRVASVGIGAEQPIASNDDQAGREKNRRIEIIIKGKNL